MDSVGDDLGTATLSGGTATASLASTTVLGSHIITATYSGDGNFLTSTSANFTQTVNQASTTTTVTNAVNPSLFGQSVTFTATVAAFSPGAGMPTGTVHFVDTTTTDDLGTATLSGGTATASLLSTTVGSHIITATYSGDTNFITSSGSMVQTVSKASTTSTLTSNPNPSVTGQAVDFTVTVSAVSPGAGTPTGTVTFHHGTTVLGTASLSGGTAIEHVPDGYTISSFFDVFTDLTLDGNFTGSTSNTLTQTINKASTATTVTNALNSSVFGQSVTFTATVAAAGLGSGTPLGVVTFEDGGSSIGTGSLSGGTTDAATFTISTLAVSTSHAITAVYNGDSNFITSVSTNTVPQTVNQASTSTTISSSSQPSVFGQSVIFTATVAAAGPGAGTPGGTVHFVDTTTSDDLGTATLSGGKATASLFSTTVLGSHIITATYSGDNNFLTSTSANFTQTVNQASTSTTISSSSQPSLFGQSVIFTATVAAFSPGAGMPTGTVHFVDTTTTDDLGTATLSGGTATASLLSTTVGSHIITATYSGDTNFITSIGSLTQTVNRGSTTTTVTGSSPSTSVFGQSVTFTALVTAQLTGTPSGGTMTFKSGATSIGTCTVSSGTATFTTSALSLLAGTDTITAVYGGDTSFAGSTSAASYLQSVNKASTTTTVTSSSANPGGVGQSITFTATVAGQGGATGMTGYVYFQVDSNPLVSEQIGSGGMATLPTSFTGLGTHTITAAYLIGDTNFTASNFSAPFLQTITLGSTTTTVTSQGSTGGVGFSVLNRSVTFTATVSGGSITPTGTVTFSDGNTSLGTGHPQQRHGHVDNQPADNGDHARDHGQLQRRQQLQQQHVGELQPGGGPGYLDLDGHYQRQLERASNWIGVNSEPVTTPINGDSLVFPASAGNLTSTNDLSGLTINSITISGSGYTLAGNATSLSGGISNTAGTSTISIPLTLTAPESFSASAGNLTVSGNVTNGGNLLTVSGAGNVTISGALSGGGGLTESGGGTLTLSGTANNTYGGVTTVSAGELDLNKTAAVDAIAGGNVTVSGGVLKNLAANQINDNSVVTVNSGTWNLNGVAETVAGLASSVATGTVNNGTATALTLTINSSGSNAYSGVISNTGGGALALTKTGTGTEILTGNNTYTGVTTISGGVLQIGNAGASGTLGSGNVTDNASLVFNITGILPVSNVISGNGTLTQAGTGTLTLTGANSYTGNSTILNGTVLIGANAALGAATDTIYLGNTSGSSNASLLINANLHVRQPDQRRGRQLRQHLDAGRERQCHFDLQRRHHVE